jgi:hypothetical protein
VDFEELGVPTVPMVTKVFEHLARLTAKSRGHPDLPILVLPFPFDQLPEERIREIARQPEMLSTLVRGLLAGNDPPGQAPNPQPQA